MNAMSPALSTAWENAAFLPVAGVPFQDARVLFAEPENTELGSRHRELGFMQLKLLYPLHAGTAAIAARADLVRAAFPRGSTFTSGGVTVVVSKTPAIGAGAVDGDRYTVAVKIRFFANIG